MKPSRWANLNAASMRTWRSSLVQNQSQTRRTNTLRLGVVAMLSAGTMLAGPYSATTFTFSTLPLSGCGGV